MIMIPDPDSQTQDLLEEHNPDYFREKLKFLEQEAREYISVVKTT
jgi:hypothetical protein